MVDTHWKNEVETEVIDSHMEESVWGVFDYTEYHNAKQRFNCQHFTTDMGSTEDELFLDDMISQLCGHNEIEIESDASLFYRILFRSDFLQISKMVKATFYGRICTKFILTNEMKRILESLDDLNMIPHVKSDIFINLVKVLNLKMIINKKCLTLNYVSRQSLYDLYDLKDVDHMVISPSAFKVMLAKYGLTFHHINFMLRLVPIRKLTLNGCNLNWTEEGNILNALALTELNISGCGTSVNKLIADNFETLKENLIELDLSNCPLYDKTLKLIAQFELEKLNIRDCIKRTGYFINNLWMELAGLGSSEKCNVDINSLWKDNLKYSLKYLNASDNDLRYADIEVISQLSLSTLDVSNTNEFWGDNYQNLSINSMKYLKELRIRDIEIDFPLLCTLFQLNLEIFEFTYNAVKNFNDFSLLLQKPTSKTLRKLTLDLQNHCQSFIHFLSKMKLTYFQCKLGTWYFYNFDVFWNNDNRKFLKTLILENGKISETDSIGIGKMEIETLHLLPVLFDSKEHILSILSSENLQCSVTDLRMGGAYEIDGDHLNLLTKFKKLKKLALKISGTNLTRAFTSQIEYFKNLKELTMKVYIGLNVDEEAAQALCNLPNGTDLTIVLVGLGKKWPLSFTEQASQIFAFNGFFYDSEMPVQLELSDCALDHRCGRIFNKFNIESLVLNSCVLESFLDSFLRGNILFTLQSLIMRRVDVDSRELVSLSNSCLSEMSILTSIDDFGYNKLPIILSEGAISKSLSVLRLGPYSCIPFVEYILKSKMSVYQFFPFHLL